MAVVVLAAGLAVNADADTTLGQFTLYNYYTPISPGSSTLSDPKNPLSATVTFTYLTSGPNSDNLAVTIANTSTPVSSNELIRDVVFQVSGNNGLLTSPLTTSSTYLGSAAYEYDSNEQITVLAGDAPTYPWSIAASATFSNSYDLSSTTTQANSNNVVNADLIGPPEVNIGSLPTSAFINGAAPALLPYSVSDITFDVNIPNLGTSATIQNVYIGYGQTNDLGGYIPLGGYVEIPSSVPTVVPEPSMGIIALALCAGAGLVLRRRRV
jgi:hypothetical protein